MVKRVRGKYVIHYGVFTILVDNLRYKNKILNNLSGINLMYRNDYDFLINLMSIMNIKRYEVKRNEMACKK